MDRMTEGRSPVLTQLLGVWFAVAQMETHSSGQTSLSAGSGARSPQVAVSTNVLVFKPVALGGRKNYEELTLTVSNAGGGILKGTATAEGPFNVIGGAYSLKAGDSTSLTVRYKPSAPGTNAGFIILSGETVTRVPVTGRAGMAPAPPGNLRRVVSADEVDHSDFIVKYISDEECWVLKPRMTEKVKSAKRPFASFCARTEVLKLAKERPKRDQAIVMVGTFFGNLELEETAKLAWANDLRSLGYKSIIFCRVVRKDNPIGQEVLNGPQATSLSPAN